MAKKKHELPRIVLRREKAPLQLRGEVGSYLPPGARYEYSPPSVLQRHRALAAVFGLLALALLVYWALAPSHDQRHEAAPPPAAAQPAEGPVYIEPIKPH